MDCARSISSEQVKGHEDSLSQLQHAVSHQEEEDACKRIDPHNKLIGTVQGCFSICVTNTLK